MGTGKRKSEGERDGVARESIKNLYFKLIITLILLLLYIIII